MYFFIYLLGLPEIWWGFSCQFSNIKDLWLFRHIYSSRCPDLIKKLSWGHWLSRLNWQLEKLLRFHWTETASYPPHHLQTFVYGHEGDVIQKFNVHWFQANIDTIFPALQAVIKNQNQPQHFIGRSLSCRFRIKSKHILWSRNEIYEKWL